MGRLFGTDGVRGVANRELTAELGLALSAAAARRLAPSTSRHRFAVVGRDPRASGEMLEAAVVAGLTSEGVDALLVGVLPTPAVAYLTAAYGADLGVMISASHNPMPSRSSGPVATNSTTTPRNASRSWSPRGPDCGRWVPPSAGCDRQSMPCSAICTTSWAQHRPASTD